MTGEVALPGAQGGVEAGLPGATEGQNWDFKGHVS